MDATTRIKNLSFALEALSRIAISGGRNSLFERVHNLLEDELKEEETKLPPPARPAKPESQFNPYTNNDDDIPF